MDPGVQTETGSGLNTMLQPDPDATLRKKPILDLAGSESIFLIYTNHWPSPHS